MTTDPLLRRIETYYDTTPRGAARAEDFGPLTLFVQSGDGYPYYARPTLGHSGPVTSEDVEKVRARQRELAVPEAFEWVDEVTPGLRAVAGAAGLSVHTHPLMVLDRAAATPAPETADVRRIRPESADLALVQSVPAVAFSVPGTATGPEGTGLRDKASLGFPPGFLVYVDERLRSGATVTYAVYDSDGPVCVGSHIPVGNTTEVVGVGTLPAARRRGLAAAVTAALVADAVAAGVDLIFLAAGDEDVARMYEKIGFRRVYTAVIAEPPEA